MSKPKRHNPSVCRSGLEAKFQSACLEKGWNFPYEQTKIKYTIPESKHSYTPDFEVTSNVFVETKGLWNTQDRKKACLIRDQHPNIKILYVLQRNQRLSKNSTTTYLDWAAKNNLDACLFSNKEHWQEFILKHL